MNFIFKLTRIGIAGQSPGAVLAAGPLSRTPARRGHPPVRANRARLNRPMIFLIGPPVIRICPKSFRIRPNSTSNRHKTHPSRASFLRPYENQYLSPQIPESGLAISLGMPQPATPRLLIGIPVIRIPPKVPGISHLKISNRHKTTDSVHTRQLPGGVPSH